MKVILIEVIVIVAVLLVLYLIRNKIRFFRGGTIRRRATYMQDDRMRMLIEDTIFWRDKTRNFRTLRVDGSNLVYSRIPLDPKENALLVYNYCAPLLGMLKGSGVSIRRTLVLGGGGGAVPRYILQNYEKATCDTVEINAESIRIAEQYFLPEFSGEGGRSHMIQADAKQAVKTLEAPYQFIFCDLYIGGQPIDAVLSHEFMTDVSRLAGDKGLLVINGGGLTMEGAGLVLINLLETFKYAWLLMLGDGFVPVATNSEMPAMDNLVRRGSGIVTLYPNVLADAVDEAMKERDK